MTYREDDEDDEDEDDEMQEDDDEEEVQPKSVQRKSASRSSAKQADPTGGWDSKGSNGGKGGRVEASDRSCPFQTSRQRPFFFQCRHSLFFFGRWCAVSPWDSGANAPCAWFGPRSALFEFTKLCWPLTPSL